MFLFQPICFISREYYNIKPETGRGMFSETLIATFQPQRKCYRPINCPRKVATSQASTPLDLIKNEN